jgi:hypothetical protein
MKSSIRRLIGAAGGDMKSVSRRRGPAVMDMEELLVKPAELSWPDFLNLLLEIAAEIEHSLMVEYLYAAYSLGGEQVPEKHRPMVEEWRNSLLTIAREEMGHLLTVQNLRCLLGAPITFDREAFPWDIRFYPFPFKLEPLSLDSLSCYVFAEMPTTTQLDPGGDKELAKRYRHFLDDDKPRIVKTVRRLAKGDPHRVGRTYEQILKIIRDVAPQAPVTLIPESCFNRSTLTRQASFADWGRNYEPEPRNVDAEGSLIDTPSQRGPRVIVTPMATRTQAIAALEDVAGQGEAPHLGGENDERSHFDRFLEIYQDYETHVRGWSPVRNVPENPTAGEPQDGQTPITAQPALALANLFNIRYRMLLAYLAHTYRLPPKGRVDEPNLRGLIIHRAFGEMYNLKTIAGLLVGLPLARGSKQCAAPPFEMPYTTVLPETDTDCWELHRLLLSTSDTLRTELLPQVANDARRYLITLGDLDAQAIAWIDQVLAGMGVRKKHSA